MQHFSESLSCRTFFDWLPQLLFKRLLNPFKNNRDATVEKEILETSLRTGNILSKA